MPTAVFVDAGFFLKRFPKVYPTKDSSDPAIVARTLHEMVLGHLNQRDGVDRRDLYRIFVYDCPPLSKKAQYPISKKPVDFSRSDTANSGCSSTMNLNVFEKSPCGLEDCKTQEIGG